MLLGIPSVPQREKGRDALALARRYRRGRARRAFSCRTASLGASDAGRRRRAAPGAGLADLGGDAFLALADRGRDSRVARAARRSDLRARERRSLLLRRRNLAAAAFRARGYHLPARAVGVLAGRRPARLEPAGLRDALAAWPRAGSGHPSPAAEREDSRAVMGRRNA